MIYKLFLSNYRNFSFSNSKLKITYRTCNLQHISILTFQYEYYILNKTLSKK